MYTLNTNMTWDEIKNMLSLAIDKDLSTVAELNGDVDLLFLDLGAEDWMIGSVRLHLMFFTEWFSCSTHPCLASVDKYKVKICFSVIQSLEIFTISFQNVPIRLGIVNNIYCFL